MSEVYFCGQCKQQQQVKDGNLCKSCKQVTVSWDTDREKAEDAMRKWKQFHGKQ